MMGESLLRARVGEVLALPAPRGQRRAGGLAVRSAFVRALGKAEKASPPLRRRFTVHDIKAKGITDHKNHHGGHRSARMRDVYVRKAEEVDSTR